MGTLSTVPCRNVPDQVIDLCARIGYISDVTQENAAHRERGKYPPKPHLCLLRKRRGWSMEHVAGLIGAASRTTVNKLEKGIMRLTEDWARKLAQAYGVSIAEIMGESGAAHLAESDVAPYDTSVGDEPVLADTQYRREVRTRALDQLDVLPGDIVTVDIGRDAMMRLCDGDLVEAQLYSATDPWDRSQSRTALRRYGHPCMLYTASSGDNSAVSTRSGAAVIVGVVVRRTRPARQSSR
jgi:transcriptional regulator with XRE-family HTH domain